MAGHTETLSSSSTSSDKDNKNDGAERNISTATAASVLEKQRDQNRDRDFSSETAQNADEARYESKIRFLDRLEHFTWAWYCLPMATGGLSLLLSSGTQPHTFTGLQTIGKMVYIWDLTIFSLITMAMTYRFVRFPTHFKASIAHPTEGLFVNTALLALASIIAAIARYGIPVCGPWLVTTYRVLFWIYFAVTFCAAVGHYFLLFTNPLLRIEDMTPAWDLPIFPFMLCGTIAASGAEFQTPDQAMPMIVAGLTAQGLGMLISILMYASYIRRMIQFGFPSPNSRPAMFIAVGPPSFTSLSLIGLANDFPVRYGSYFVGATTTTMKERDEITIQILRAMATMTAVFIWSLAFWFLCVSILACLAVRKQMTFHLNWWAFVFPNVGFTIATIDLGKTFRSQGIMWVGSVMTILLVVLYLWVGFNHVRAVYRREIMWRGKDEDVYVKEMHGKKEGPLADRFGEVVGRRTFRNHADDGR